MHKFVRALVTEWRRLQLPSADATVIVAVSGGADSTALLLALAELKKRKKLDLEIAAAHYNHGLRGRESEEDEKFVSELAGSLNIPFTAGRPDKPLPKSNIEQRARESRYEFLASVATERDANLVLTAHTLNDQAETFLINLIRGSGPDGLAAIKPVRELGQAGLGDGRLLVRPMVRWAMRADTEDFCQDSGVEFRRDAMNDDVRFTRVRIRKELIPKLAEFNPKIIQTLARTAETLAGFVPETAAGPPATLLVRELKKLEKPELYSKLRSWLKRERGDLRRIDLRHIESIGHLIYTRKSGKTAELPGGQQVVKQGGRLEFVHETRGPEQQEGAQSGPRM